MDKDDLIYDDSVFSIKERGFEWIEVQAQNRLYDALTSGHHGARLELEWEGHRFVMATHGFQGWVPHMYIYAWLKIHG
eukprot:15977024-Heterocapsa_arctica.AAC.1